MIVLIPVQLVAPGAALAIFIVNSKYRHEWMVSVGKLQLFEACGAQVIVWANEASIPDTRRTLC